VLSPLELIEKLAALIPPPRLNLVRYHVCWRQMPQVEIASFQGHRKWSQI